MKKVYAAFGFGFFGFLVIIYADNRETFQRATTRAADATVAWWTAFLWSLLAVAVLVVIGLLVIAYKRNYHADRNRIIDGNAALREYRVGRVWWNPWSGTRALFDPNLMESSVAYITDQGIVEGPPIREPVRIETQRTRHIQAMYPGDAVLASSRAPIMQPKPASMRSIAAKPAKPSAPLALPAPEPVTSVTPPRLALVDALKQSTADRWIVGQAEDGKLAAFNPRAHAHAAIVGSTGTGKTTSVGYALVLQAIRQQYHTIILDPDGGADWSRFRSHCEWHEADRTTFPGQVEAIHRLFESRADDANVQPVFVVLEEYGDLIRQLRVTSKADADGVDVMLDTLLRRGRKRGVHLCFIDQYPEHWSQQVIGGTKFRAVFQLGPNQGAKLEEYKAAQLPDVGTFLVREQRYLSWDAAASASTALSYVPVGNVPRIIDGAPVRSFGAAGEGGSTSGSEPTEPPPNRTTEPEETDAQRCAKAMIDADPATRQVDLVNALEISKVYASELWHRYHPAGKNYQADDDAPADESPTPTDAMGRPQTVIDASDPANAALLAEIRQAIEGGKASVAGRKAA